MLASQTNVFYSLSWQCSWLVVLLTCGSQLYIVLVNEAVYVPFLLVFLVMIQTTQRDWLFSVNHGSPAVPRSRAGLPFFSPVPWRWADLHSKAGFACLGLNSQSRCIVWVITGKAKRNVTPSRYGIYTGSTCVTKVVTTRCKLYVDVSVVHLWRSYVRWASTCRQNNQSAAFNGSRTPQLSDCRISALVIQPAIQECVFQMFFS